MSRKIKICISLCISLFIFSLYIYQESVNVYAADIVDENSDSVGIVFTNVDKYETAYYLMNTLSSTIEYDFIGSRYDFTHTYKVELVNMQATMQVVILETDNMIEFTASQKGQYELEFKITDLTTSTEYLQCVPLYAGLDSDYLVLATSGVKDTVSVEFDYPYIMNDGSFEFVEQYYDTSDILQKETFTSIDFCVVGINPSDILDSIFYYSNEKNTEVVNVLLSDNIQTFTVNWIGDTSKSSKDNLEIYIQYNSSLGTETIKTCISLSYTFNDSSVSNVFLDIAYDPDKDTYVIPNDLSKCYTYDFFLSTRDLNLSLTGLNSYLYTSLFSLPSCFKYNNLSFTLDAAQATSMLDLQLGSNEFVYLNMILKDNKGTSVGYTCLKITIELSVEERDLIGEIFSAINSLSYQIEYLPWEEYINYSEDFDNISSMLQKLDKNKYNYIENYATYEELKPRYDISLLFRNVTSSLSTICGYNERYFSDNDSTMIETYNNYLKLPPEMVSRISDKKTLFALLDYIKYRDQLLYIEQVADSYSQSSNQSLEEAALLFQQYASLDASAEKFLPYELQELLHSVKILLEMNVTSLEFEAQDKINLFLSNSSNNEYFVSLDQRFVNSGLVCNWLVVGDEIFTYENGNAQIWLYPYKTGKCKIIAYYQTLDGTILSDELEVIVLQNDITADIVIQKDAEGSYTIYDTLNFKPQLSYSMNFSDNATCEWKINDEIVSNNFEFNYRFTNAGTYDIECKIIDEQFGTEEIISKRSIQIISVADSDFTLSMNYQEKVYAYLNGTEFVVDAYLDGFLNPDYSYEWKILDQKILDFYIQSSVGPQVVLTPLKVGSTSVVVMVDVGRYQSKILMFSLEIEVIEHVESVELYREDSGLKPNSNVLYRASINNLANVVNLDAKFSVDYSESDDVKLSSIDNELKLEELGKGKYTVTVTIEGVSSSDTFKIQTVAVDQILLSALPFIVITAFVLFEIKWIYSKKRSKLLVINDKVKKIQDKMQELREKLVQNQIQKNNQKVVLKNLRKWKNNLVSLNIATKNLSIQKNLELEVAEKSFAEIIFILEAGIKAFKIKYYEKTVCVYLDKLCKNNLTGLLNIFGQKIKTVQLQKSSESIDDFAEEMKREKKKRLKQSNKSPKDYADYLKKINYYDAEENDSSND